MNLMWLIECVLMMNCLIGSAIAQPLPNQAKELLPVLQVELVKYWPEIEPRAFLPAVIEQESLWKFNAKLKTDREFGCGLGQFTIAYDAKGKVRFDALKETKALDSSLKDWTWKDCYNAQYQMRGVVLKLKGNDRQCSIFMQDNMNSKACTAAAYNGGMGSVSRRIRSCKTQRGCNAQLWLDNLEKQCPQSRNKVQGYAEDFCTINSKYPGRVFSRLPKYEGKI